MAEVPIWGIHVRGMEGDINCRENSLIGIGWHEIGNLNNLAPTREAFKAAVAPFFPEKTKGYIINAASQLYRFAHEMKEGHRASRRTQAGAAHHQGSGKERLR